MTCLLAVGVHLRVRQVTWLLAVSVHLSVRRVTWLLAVGVPLSVRRVMWLLAVGVHPQFDKWFTLSKYICQASLTGATLGNKSSHK